MPCKEVHMATYSIYSIYGRDKGYSYIVGMSRPYILGMPKEITNIRERRELERATRSNTLIVDWKSRRYKMILNGREDVWRRFKNDDWYRNFRFTTPCEDWELSSKGYIKDVLEL